MMEDNSTCNNHQSSTASTPTKPTSSCHTPILAEHPLYILSHSDLWTEQHRPPTPPISAPIAKLFSRIIEDLSNILVLPHNQPLVNEEIIRQLPPGHPLRPFYLDVVTGTDNVPLLSMSGDEEYTTGGGAGSPETPGRGGRRKANAKAKVEDLGNSVPDGSLPGGKTFDQLPLYEKKSVLINRELDDMGMGRYQWCIFFLCGFGYFLDLCWAQAFGLVASPLSKELGIPEGRIGDLSTAFNAGLTIGAFTWGLLVDILGRKWCFNITCIFASVFGFLFAAPSNFSLLCFFASMIGFGVGGNIPIDATITIEALPRNRRYLLAALSTFQPLGTVSATLVAYGLIPRNSCDPGLPACSTGETPCCTKSSNMGWRYTMITLGCVTLFIFICRFVIFTFRESPKFLLAKGHDAHALDVLYSIAKFNRVAQPKLTMDDFNALDHEDRSRQSRISSDSGSDADSRTGMMGNASASNVITHFFQMTFGHLKKLFADKAYAYVFVVLTIAYMSYFWSFSVAGFFLPILLAQQGVDQGQSVEETYRNYIWIYLPGITATAVAAGLMEVPRVGRKWGMVASSALMGVALALLVDSIPASVGFNAMEYWFQSVYGALLYAFTPESFPAPVRGSASGMLSTLGRIASIVAPIAAGHLYSGEGKSPGILFLAAGAAWVSTLAILCLPISAKGKQAY